MKLSVALFFAGLFGALAAVFILLSFGTDYWLLASESCHPNPSRPVDLGVTVQVGVGMTIEWFEFEILPPPEITPVIISLYTCRDLNRLLRGYSLEPETYTEVVKLNLQLFQPFCH